MATVFELVNDLFERIAERRKGATEVEGKKLTPATATPCPVYDIFGRKRVAADDAERVFNGLEPTPTGLTDNAESRFTDNTATQSTGAWKNNTQEGVNQRCECLGDSLQASLPAGRGDSQALFFLKQTLFLQLLAIDAMSCPRNRFQSFLLNFIVAGNAGAEFPHLKPFDGFVNQL